MEWCTLYMTYKVTIPEYHRSSVSGVRAEHTTVR